MRHPRGVLDRADHDHRFERRLSIAGRILIFGREEIDRNWHASVSTDAANGTIRAVLLRA
jgi:hypothetical protein